LETHYGAVAPPSIKRLRVEGLSRIVWAMFFALTVALIPILTLAGGFPLAVWGVALPLLALGVAIALSRLEIGRDQAPNDVCRAFRLIQEEKLLLTLAAFIVCSIPAQTGLVFDDFARDMAWILCAPPLFQFFKHRRWSAMVEACMIIATVILIQMHRGAATVVILGTGISLAWACRGLVDTVQSNQREAEH